MGRHRTGSAGAIRSALHRLGMHAGPAAVVAELARLGLRVGEDQVEEVRFDLLKGSHRGGCPAPTPRPVGHPPFLRPRKNHR
jgi:hypothetical protein